MFLNNVSLHASKCKCYCTVGSKMLHEFFFFNRYLQFPSKLKLYSREFFSLLRIQYYCTI
jgi:hypothetical protein